jgi:hypothetical protein
MEKKYIIGGLAIVGAIALFAYLKPKKKLNSDGFYGANGKMSFPNLTTNPFVPSSFTRQDRFCKVCVQYDKKPSPKGGFFYTKSLYNPNNQISELFGITEEEFTMAFTKNGLCGKTIPQLNIYK